MKVKEKVREQVIESLETSRRCLVDRCRRIEDAMAEAPTVEKLISLKREYLHAWMSSFPVYGDGCYFCVARRGGEDACAGCPYGKVHGNCTTVRGESDWKELLNAVLAVGKCLNDYYIGETYPEED